MQCQPPATRYDGTDLHYYSSRTLHFFIGFQFIIFPPFWSEEFFEIIGTVRSIQHSVQSLGQDNILPVEYSSWLLNF